MKKNIILLGTKIGVISTPLATVIACANNDSTKNDNANQDKSKEEQNSPQEKIKNLALKKLGTFVENVKSKKINLNDYTEKAASEIRYMNYLLNLNKSNINDKNFQVYTEGEQFKIKVFWPYKEDYKRFEGDKGELTQRENFDKYQGRIIKIPHDNHYDEKFVSWKESPPKNDEEQKIYDNHFSKQKAQDLRKGYIYSFKLNKVNDIDWHNVKIETDLFFQVFNPENVNFANKKDVKFEYSFNPGEEAFNPSYKKVSNFFSIDFNDLEVFRFKVDKVKFLNGLREHAKDNLINPNESDFTKLKFKANISKDLAEELLEGIIKDENENPKNTFLDKYYYGRGKKSIISYHRNGFDISWPIKDTSKEVLFDITNQLFKNNSKIIGFDEIDMQPKILNWYLNLQEKIPSIKERAQLTRGEFQNNYDAHQIMNTIAAVDSVSKKLLYLKDVDAIKLLNNANNSKDSYNQWVNETSSYFANLWKNDVPKNLKIGKVFNNPKEILTKYLQKLKIKLPWEMEKTKKVKFYWFKNNNKKHYVKDFTSLVNALSLWKKGDTPDIEGKLAHRPFRIFKENADKTQIALMNTKEKIQYDFYGRTKSESLSDLFTQNFAFERHNNIDLGIIFFPENFLAFKEENIFYLSYNERAFKTNEDRAQWVNKDKFGEYFQL